jgi:hypothetical protein
VTVALERDDTYTWAFALRARRDITLLVDIRANATVRGTRVTGDTHYGATLVVRP